MKNISKAIEIWTKLQITHQGVTKREFKKIATRQLKISQKEAGDLYKYTCKRLGVKY